MSLSHATVRTNLRKVLRTSHLTPNHLRLASGTSDWTGRQPQEHVTNKKDELNVQSSASKAGQDERAKGNANDSQATTEEDAGNQNKQAKKDHPEAPGPVIGMNDERGQVSSCFFLVPCLGAVSSAKGILERFALIIWQMGHNR